MKVSEKSLELNVGAELLWLLRNSWGLPKTYLRGLTQKEEKAEGADFFAQLSSSARLFAFQFKAPRGPFEGPPYRYKLASDQHDLLFSLSQTAPNAVFYVFPYYVTPAKLQQDVPTLLQDTWLLRIGQMPTATVFGGKKTTTVYCLNGTASINPEYPLENLGRLAHEPPAQKQNAAARGVRAADFAEWYDRYRRVRSDEGKWRNPWLVRGLRIAIVDA